MKVLASGAAAHPQPRPAIERRGPARFEDLIQGSPSEQAQRRAFSFGELGVFGRNEAAGFASAPASAAPATEQLPEEPNEVAEQPTRSAEDPEANPAPDQPMAASHARSVVLPQAKSASPQAQGQAAPVSQVPPVATAANTRVGEASAAQIAFVPGASGPQLSLSSSPEVTGAGGAKRTPLHALAKPSGPASSGRFQEALKAAGSEAAAPRNIASQLERRIAEGGGPVSVTVARTSNGLEVVVSLPGLSDADKDRIQRIAAEEGERIGVKIQSLLINGGAQTAPTAFVEGRG